MKNKYFIHTLLLAVLTLVWGCGSDDDDKTETPIPDTPTPDVPVDNPNYMTTAAETIPAWKIDWSSDEAVPNWESMQPDPKAFETWSIVVVKLDNTLAPFASMDDMMAVFINDEMRAFAHPATREDGSFVNESGEVFFILKILGNEDSGNDVGFTLKYYSCQLHQTFSRVGHETFKSEKTYGIEEDFMPSLVAGSTKYPIQMELNFSIANLSETSFKCTENDIVAVFVGDECRGISHADPVYPKSPHNFFVYGKRANEVATVCYYSYDKKVFYTFYDRFVISQGRKKILEVNL